MAVAHKTVLVPTRFCGPPTSGNGGYTCGLLAAALPASRTDAVECTIRKPIPLERELFIEVRESGAVLLDGDELVIEAKPTLFDFDLPSPVSHELARQAVEVSPAFTNHPFPTCFVCGPDRHPHDGLNIFPGPATDAASKEFENLFLATWTPAREFADDLGNVCPEFIWAAMDCPTGFAAGFPYAGKLVTGRLAVQLAAPVRAGEECIVMSWSLGNDGRKCHAAAVVYQDKIACAIARATWIKLT